MTATPFAVTVNERPAVTLFGVSIRTSLAKASADCPRLWEDVFCPRMPEVAQKPADSFLGDSYGICVMTSNEGVFDYWAAMEPASGLSLPEGLKKITLPAGLYAGCRVPSLEKLGEAYMYLYSQWPATTPGHTPDMTAPCFELYGKEYLQSGALELFMPLKRG